MKIRRLRRVTALLNEKLQDISDRNRDIKELDDAIYDLTERVTLMELSFLAEQKEAKTEDFVTFLEKNWGYLRATRNGAYHLRPKSALTTVLVKLASELEKEVHKHRYELLMPTIIDWRDTEGHDLRNIKNLKLHEFIVSEDGQQAIPIACLFYAEEKGNLQHYQLSIDSEHAANLRILTQAERDCLINHSRESKIYYDLAQRFEMCIGTHIKRFIDHLSLAEQDKTENDYAYQGIQQFRDFLRRLTGEQHQELLSATNEQGISFDMLLQELYSSGEEKKENVNINSLPRSLYGDTLLDCMQDIFDVNADYFYSDETRESIEELREKLEKAKEIFDEKIWDGYEVTYRSRHALDSHDYRHAAERIKLCERVSDLVKQCLEEKEDSAYKRAELYMLLITPHREVCLNTFSYLICYQTEEIIERLLRLLESHIHKIITNTNDFMDLLYDRWFAPEGLSEKFCASLCNYFGGDFLREKIRDLFIMDYKFHGYSVEFKQFFCKRMVNFFGANDFIDFIKNGNDCEKRNAIEFLRHAFYSRKVILDLTRNLSIDSQNIVLNSLSSRKLREIFIKDKSYLKTLFDVEDYKNDIPMYRLFLLGVTKIYWAGLKSACGAYTNQDLLPPATLQKEFEVTRRLRRFLEFYDEKIERLGNLQDLQFEKNGIVKLIYDKCLYLERNQQEFQRTHYSPRFFDAQCVVSSSDNRNAVEHDLHQITHAI